MNSRPQSVSVRLEVSEQWLEPASAQEFLPRTVQGFLEAEKRGEENVELSSLDFLNGADVQVNQFSESQLGELSSNAFTPHILSKPNEARVNLTAFYHASFRRDNGLTNTARWGVIMLNQPKERIHSNLSVGSQEP